MRTEHSGWIAQAGEAPAPRRWHWRSVCRVIARGAGRVRRPADDDEDAPPEVPPRPRRPPIAEGKWEKK